MRKVRTVCVSLEPVFVRMLDDLAKEKGSKSAAIRDLLLEHAYREYYSDPRNVREQRELADAWLSVASLPEEPYYDRGQSIPRLPPCRRAIR